MPDNIKRASQQREREELFAVFCTHLGSPWEAARRVGFEPHLADWAARDLMNMPHISRKIRRQEKALEQSTKSLALRLLLRLAGYSAGDGVKLALTGDEMWPEEVGELDLFGISSLKYSSAGCEVKFFDRLRAIELLLAMTGESDCLPADFYRALRESAAQTGQAAEDTVEHGD